MDCYDKLTILADAAKYDVACTSSGSRRTPRRGEVGCTLPAGCCHSFSADGRCITLLKVLLSNACSYDCAYCVNRRSARCSRATFGPRELAALTLDFYKRNYIEGLFLSSAVLKDADNTAERMIACLRILRGELHFRGYVHTKVIPGTSPELIDVIGHLSDRLSVNLELPSARSLTALCPDKDKGQIVRPMEQIFRERTAEEQLLAQAPKRRKGLPPRDAQDTDLLALATGTAGLPASALRPKSERSFEREGAELGGWGARYTLRRHARVATSRRSFAPAGQSTQLIIGATPESDNQILKLSSALYEQFDLKRIFFSAYVPVMADDRMPATGTPVPLRREHRLYQADWLMRYYAFSADELTNPQEPWLDLDVDPKLAWALRNINLFPVEVMEATLQQLLRVPGIGPVGARRILAARKARRLGFNDLRRLHIVLKRAAPFLSCNGKRQSSLPLDAGVLRQEAIRDATSSSYLRTRRSYEQSQLSLF
jgi:putative DNA modification/repair radical SAM protein